MSSIFGPTRQIGYVVHNLDEALDRWLALGIGPFFRADHVPLEYLRVGGKQVDVDLSLAMANSGEVQIELIQQHNPEPSPYKDFLDRHGPGMQHLGFWSTNYEEDLARIQASGQRIAFEGKIVDSGCFTYFNSPFEPDTFMEVGDLTGNAALLMEHVRAAAIDWDGTHPVRPLSF